MIFLLAFTLIDVQNAYKNGECRSDCKYDGYVSVAYFADTGKCWCASPLQIHLPSKRLQIKTDTMPYKEPDYKLPFE